MHLLSKVRTIPKFGGVNLFNINDSATFYFRVLCTFSFHDEVLKCIDLTFDSSLHLIESCINFDTGTLTVIIELGATNDVIGVEVLNSIFCSPSRIVNSLINFVCNNGC